MNGKGDKRRPGDMDKYREGWERIFGGKYQEAPPRCSGARSTLGAQCAICYRGPCQLGTCDVPL